MAEVVVRRRSRPLTRSLKPITFAPPRSAIVVSIPESMTAATSPPPSSPGMSSRARVRPKAACAVTPNGTATASSSTCATSGRRASARICAGVARAGERVDQPQSRRAPEVAHRPLDRADPRRARRRAQRHEHRPRRGAAQIDAVEDLVVVTVRPYAPRGRRGRQDHGNQSEQDTETAEVHDHSVAASTSAVPGPS